MASLYLFVSYAHPLVVLYYKQSALKPLANIFYAMVENLSSFIIENTSADPFILRF